MVSVSNIISYETNLWGVRRGGQSTNIVSRGNIDGSLKRIKGITGSFFSLKISSMGMGGGFKYGLPQSTGKGLFNHS